MCEPCLSVSATPPSANRAVAYVVRSPGFAILPWDRDVVPAGETVEFLPLPA